MIKCVRFIKEMFPWQAHATALLPAGQADRMIREGFAVAHCFPDRPHAVDASAVRDPAPAPVGPRQRPVQTCKTRRAS
jgi:hypothetical protein